MNNNRKKYVQINSHTSSDQIFALLDSVQSGEEVDIEELMNNSGIEFFANYEDIANIVPDSDNADILTPKLVFILLKIMKTNREKIRKTSLTKSNFSGDLKLLLTLEKNAILLQRFPTN